MKKASISQQITIATFQNKPFLKTNRNNQQFQFLVLVCHNNYKGSQLNDNFHIGVIKPTKRKEIKLLVLLPVVLFTIIFSHSFFSFRTLNTFPKFTTATSILLQFTYKILTPQNNNNNTKGDIWCAHKSYYCSSLLKKK